jgi:hypothetical protein
VETLINFATFNALGLADLGNGVVIRKEEQKLIILEDQEEVAKIKDKIDILIDTDTTQEYIKYGLL